MNRDRRRQLRAISDELDELRGRVAFLKEEEDAYIEGIPDNMEQKREAADEGVTKLEDALEKLEEAVDEINGAIGE